MAGETSTFVAAIIQVDEILLELCWESGGIDGVSVVLGGDVALTSCQIESGNVVGSVSVLELDGTGTCCKSKQLVTKTDTKDWNLGGFHQSGQVVDSFLAVSWIAGAIGDENTIEVMGNLVDWEIVWEDSGACTTSNQASQDVLLDTAVDHR